MAITINQPVVSGHKTEYVNKSTQMGKEDFLKLLVTQLQHQDPLNPMDSVEFTAQLAQFSALEQQKNINENLEALLSLQKTQGMLNLSSLVGRKVQAQTDQIVVGDQSEVGLSFELAQDVSSGVATITDAMGNLVRTLKVSSLKKGLNTITWDMRDNNGRPVPPGQYSFQFSGMSADKSQVTGTPVLVGKVEGVNFQDGNALLVVDGRQIAISKVTKIMDTTEGSQGGGS
jgi:flagellar basal-body rod modification protein FlgD